MPLTGRSIYFLDVLLRVPPVFLLDVSVNYSYSTADDDDEAISDGRPALYYYSILARLSGVLGSIFMFILPTDMLVASYVWLASVGALFASYRAGVFFMSQTATLEAFAAHFLLQCVLTLVFGLTTRRTPYYYGRSVAAGHRHFVVGLFAVPPLLTALGLSFGGVLHVAVTSVQVFYVVVGAASHAGTLLSIVGHVVWWMRVVVRQNGLPLFLDAEWTRLQVPHVLRVFWLARLCEHVVLLLSTAAAAASSPSLRTSSADDVHVVSETVKQLLVKGCDTVVALLGMSSIVSSVAHHIGRGVQQFLSIQDDDDKSFGTVSAILFFVLALQTGLTGLEPEKRFVRLYRNFCLLFTAVLHFVHNMVSPLLMSLSASRNRSVGQHVRALTVCTFLVLFPCWFLTFLWNSHPPSTWLLAVSAFSIEVTVKVVISLLIYTLFMLDAYRNTFWERLDDYVYYIRATGNTVEFLFGIFLFFNGAWILMFESGGAIRAIMMCIHAYFNIWVQAKTGWKVFIRRRTAVNKINTFPEATSEQLRSLDDVCAICYQEMSTARITWCRHYFHALCLRKWLYIQDRCPMCHKALYDTEEERESGQPDADVVPPDRGGRQQPALVVVRGGGGGDSDGHD